MSVRLKKLQSETIRLINETTTTNNNSSTVALGNVISPTQAQSTTQPSTLSLIKKRLASPITNNQNDGTSSSGLLSPSGVLEVLNILAQRKNNGMHVSPITSNGNTPSSGFLSKGFTLKGGRNSIADALTANDQESTKSFTAKKANAIVTQDL